MKKETKQEIENWKMKMTEAEEDKILDKEWKKFIILFLSIFLRIQENEKKLAFSRQLRNKNIQSKTYHIFVFIQITVRL